VLRFPSDAIWLGLGPHRVGAVRLRRGKGEPIAAVDVAGDADPLPALLRAAGDMLGGHAVRGSRLHVVLSDRLVRYALLPFSAAYLDAHEEHALCLARFAETFGPMPDWRIAIEPARYGRARVACALPPALDEGLRALCADRALAPGMVVPHFVTRWNRRPPAFARRGMVAVAERDTLVLASFDRQGWHSLRTRYADTRDGAVADLIARERLLQGIAAETPLWVCGTVALGPDVAALGAVAPPRDPDPGIALAWAGAAR
jgi:hypothetical protein